jgi:hypothetical protein
MAKNGGCWQRRIYTPNLAAPNFGVMEDDQNGWSRKRRISGPPKSVLFSGPPKKRPFLEA